MYSSYQSLTIAVHLLLFVSVIHLDADLSLSVFFLPVNVLKFNSAPKCDAFSLPPYSLRVLFNF